MVDSLWDALHGNMYHHQTRADPKSTKQNTHGSQSPFTADPYRLGKADGGEKRVATQAHSWWSLLGVRLGYVVSPYLQELGAPRERVLRAALPSSSAAGAFPDHIQQRIGDRTLMIISNSTVNPVHSMAMVSGAKGQESEIPSVKRDGAPVPTRGAADRCPRMSCATSRRLAYRRKRLLQDRLRGPSSGQTTVCGR